MNPTDEAAIYSSDIGPTEWDVLADNDRLAAENIQLRAILDSWDAYPLVEIKRCFDTLCNEQRFRLGYTHVVVSDLLGAIADLLPELLPEPVEETLSPTEEWGTAS